MNLSLDLWVLCPPERGQGDIKRLQRELAHENPRAVALPPFLPLGEWKGEGSPKEFLDALGVWEISGDWSVKGERITLPFTLAGGEGFLKCFSPVPFLEDQGFLLTLSKGKGFRALSPLSSQVFHIYRLCLWNIEFKRDNLDWVEWREIKVFYKKRT